MIKKICKWLRAAIKVSEEHDRITSFMVAYNDVNNEASKHIVAGDPEAADHVMEVFWDKHLQSSHKSHK